MSTILKGLLLITSLACFSALALARQAESPGNLPGAALALQDLDGRSQDLRQYSGRIVVVNFWATWCLPCREEMPMLGRAKERYASQGVEIIAASTDDLSALKAVARFARQQKLSLPVWVGATLEDMNRFGLGDALPATAIIDRDGTIAFRIRGVIQEDELSARLEYLLGDRSGPAAPPPQMVETLPEPAADHDHDHAGEEEHEHGGVGMEGASLVPS